MTKQKETIVEFKTWAKDRQLGNPVATGYLMAKAAWDAAVAAERERCSKEFVENGRAIGRAQEREVCVELADVGIHPASVISLDGTSTARTSWQDGWNAAVEEIAGRMERSNV